MSIGICVAVASNDPDILARNLMASDLIACEFVDLRIDKNAASAASAYNQIMDQSEAEIFIFAHQDVYFPPGWETRLLKAIDDVQAVDPNWAVLAPTGISMDDEHVGAVWSTSQGAIVGRVVKNPVPAQSIDELVVVLRRSSGVRFDDMLPGFHLFGTDIVQNARAAGKGAYICNLPLVHNDAFHDRLGADFAKGYGMMRRKWQANLPLKTTVLDVTRSGVAWSLYRVRAANSVAARAAKASDNLVDPRIYSDVCGWENRAELSG